MDNIFSRTERLLGSQALAQMATKRIIIFGVGGVGSWCAECLVRTGFQHITIVDADTVSITNVNRQLMATTKTVGQSKVEVLRQRLLEINPEVHVNALHQLFSAETASSFQLQDYDYIIDAIDSLEDKAQLILLATQQPGRLFSSMGAALKLDATRIQVGEFWKVNGCPLAKALRNRFKRKKEFPAKKFKCVFSPELLTNLGKAEDAPLQFHKVAANGSLCHITATFGMQLAGMVIQDCCSEVSSDDSL